MLVRFVAVALIGFSLAVGALVWLGKSLPGVAGLVMLIKARTLAQWLADWLDN